MKPFSNNIIFLDTEFSTLNPYKGEILSVGLIKLNDEELYLELEYNGEYEDWVKENILPNLKGPKVNREEAIKRIKEFIGEEKPFMVGYVNQFDAVYWKKLFNNKENPCYWIPIDFASILFALGIDPESYYTENKNNFFEKLGIDVRKYKKHNALDDAKLLKETYLKLIQKY